jgi:hypothetical protein
MMLQVAASKVEVATATSKLKPGRIPSPGPIGGLPAMKRGPGRLAPSGVARELDPAPHESECRGETRPPVRSVVPSLALMQARYGTALQVDSLWNRWFRRQRLHCGTRMRPKLHLPGFGHAFPGRVTGMVA